MRSTLLLRDQRDENPQRSRRRTHPVLLPAEGRVQARLQHPFRWTLQTLPVDRKSHFTRVLTRAERTEKPRSAGRGWIYTDVGCLTSLGFNTPNGGKAIEDRRRQQGFFSSMRMARLKEGRPSEGVGPWTALCYAV